MKSDPPRRTPASGATDSASSPCIGVCRMDALTGWCEGCLRNLEEIAAWGGLAEAQRRRLMQTLPARRAVFVQRTGRAPATPPTDS